MKGKLLVVPADGSDLRIRELLGPPTLGDLQAAVGGDIQLIPDLETIDWQDAVQGCVAFCHEEGKLLGLPMNANAQLLWEDASDRRFGIRERDDVLVGDVAIVIGDEELLRRI